MAMQRYMVRFEDVPAWGPEEQSRSHRYQARLHHAADFRDRLLRFLKEQGMEEQVCGVEEATLFNVLFLDATEEAARRLREMPGVLAVAHEPNLDLVLA